MNADPLSVACPKCLARPGQDCNPHTDAKTGKPVYREPHERRVALAEKTERERGIGPDGARGIQKF